jgi:hypothetical protein
MCAAHPTCNVARGFVVALVAGVLLAGPPPARAASFDVACDVTALITTLTAANASVEPDTLQLASGCTYELTAVSNSTAGPNGLPFITSRLTIEGNGATIARSGAAGTPAFRILAIGGSGTLTLNNVTVTGGLTADGDTGDPGDPGGGILNSGILLLSNSTVSGNATGAGGPATGAVAGGAGGGGGGIGNTGTLTLINTTVSGNVTGAGGSSDAARGGAGGSGGGILNLGTLDVIGSTVSGNTTGAGGAGSSSGAGGSGGGIASVANNSTLTLTTSTVSGNSSIAGGLGGGVFSAGTATISSSTVTNNTAGTNGGGVRNNGGTLTMANTIVAGNTDSSGANPDISGVITSQGYNLIGHVGNTNFASNTTGDIYGDPNNSTGARPGSRELAIRIPPGLAPLAHNGGPTATHALLRASPATDQGYCGAPMTDQRGTPRPFEFPEIANGLGGDGCDIGAFEAVYLVHLPVLSR